MEIDTQKEKIEKLLSRSIENIYPSKKGLEKKLLEGKQLRVYIGIDPTNTYVHLGHSTNYLLLRRFHELGHKTIVLIGDFTAMIGDPSDKDAVRTRLTKEEVQENVKGFKDQIGKILDFKDEKNPVEFRYNSEWLSKLTFEEIVNTASNFTVQQMIQRDVFERRLDENKPLYVHEFFYPLMQGYDSVALDADIEIGGTDQTFNMLAGRTLVKRHNNKEKFVITTTLLENPDTGEKLMSKSRGTGVPLNTSASDMYAKVMALPDSGIIQCFVNCTELPLGRIEDIEGRLKKGDNPKNIKMELARTIVSMYHGEQKAQQAEGEFEKIFSDGGVPGAAEEIKAEKGDVLMDIVVGSGQVSSKSQYRRLVEQGAVQNVESGEKIKDEHFKVGKNITLRIGKKRFLKIYVS